MSRGATRQLVDIALSCLVVPRFSCFRTTRTRFYANVECRVGCCLVRIAAYGMMRSLKRIQTGARQGKSRRQEPRRTPLASVASPCLISLGRWSTISQRVISPWNSIIMWQRCHTPLVGDLPGEGGHMRQGEADHERRRAAYPLRCRFAPCQSSHARHPVSHVRTCNARRFPSLREPLVPLRA